MKLRTSPGELPVSVSINAVAATFASATVHRMTCLFLSGILFAVAGCTSSSDEPARSEAPPVPTAEAAPGEPSDVSGSSASDADASTRRDYTGISFRVPDDWRELPDQRFVDSKFIIPSETGDMQITLTSMGGGIEANLNRWVGQVQREPGDEPSWSTVNIAGVESRQVDVRGSFNSRVGDNPGTKQDWRLIGIAVPLPRNFFIKLVGPRESVVEYQDEFQTFLKSARREDR